MTQDVSPFSSDPAGHLSWQPVTLGDARDGIVLYDGVCVLCSAWFHFVARRDPAARFRFTQVQDTYGRQLAIELGIDPANPQTNAVIIEGIAYFRSDAALRLLRLLPGWRWVQVLLAVPGPLRDWVYDRVARHRYRFFGRTELCLVPDRELQRHVLCMPAHGGGNAEDPR